ncbi:MAG: riboflavin synthase [Candidatus Neomarinimicrobiota bacterium]|nr:MAG: riboflavin synthase [Candidatus Neomarinimicrobiota bacterium]
MFTGLVEEIGTIKEYKSIPDGKEAWIEGHIVIDDLKKDDSISCSGICLTVVETENQLFKVQLVNETLNKTTAKSWNNGTKLNLERALLPTSRMGGHFVQGHVDGTVKILDIIPMEDSAVWHFSLPENLQLFLVDKGSICLDGISLTIVEKFDNYFTVALIPHTLSVTTWGQKRVNDLVNIEVDIMAKYIQNLMPKGKDEV